MKQFVPEILILKIMIINKINMFQIGYKNYLVKIII